MQWCNACVQVQWNKLHIIIIKSQDTEKHIERSSPTDTDTQGTDAHAF